MSIRSKVKFTYDDFINLEQDREIAELIMGEIIIPPAPSTPHQIVLHRLYRQIIQQTNLKLDNFFMPPTDLKLNDENVFQPDLMYVEDNQIHQQFIEGSPLFIVEVLSKSNASSDLIIKKQIYEINGVREYWIVNHEKKEITVYIYENGAFDTGMIYGKGSVIKSKIISVNFNTQILFENLPES